ncbi:ABC transporter substrate-binding protein [Beijerinckia indica]|uniref:Periplasmic binding protein/LacI transcriptional regulator n=1 Tax=Beijerinckia indica subsp. indica (strain ATCC 9039 / DSM 1715 / NCIMB 8712) TaxID=395963 RepID=B2IBK6_BEII9|nr:ABC transporter substrate-binding protein [Beijerinckia indica]ACB96632.1 periplasmic binding protein/LacI transcriptional regulator [Beijerinckia indica subsp. indica ATCC 9039]
MNKVLVAAAAVALMTAHASAKDLKSIGLSLASMDNPYFVAMAKGATASAQKINPNVKINTLDFDYDLNKQATQIDSLIASGVDLILLNPGDPAALEPAIQRAHAAGIPVIAVDAAAKGADITITTDNRQAGEIACQYIVDKLGGKGNVIIQNGPQVSSVRERVEGCKKALANAPEIAVLSSDQNAKGSHRHGMNVMQDHLSQFAKIDAVFTINDRQAIGSDFAAQRLHRNDLIITSVDGAPDIEVALKAKNTCIHASASQDPYAIAQLAVDLGNDLLNGKKPEQDVILIAPKLVTRENVAEYKGWRAER